MGVVGGEPQVAAGLPRFVRPCLTLYGVTIPIPAKIPLTNDKLFAPRMTPQMLPRLQS
jgi:hypothetical protein